MAKRKPTRKHITIRVSYPANMTARNAKSHIGAALNWWIVKVIPENKIRFIVKR